MKQLGFPENFADSTDAHWHWIDKGVYCQTPDVYLSSANGLSETGEIVFREQPQQNLNKKTLQPRESWKTFPGRFLLTPVKAVTVGGQVGSGLGGIGIGFLFHGDGARPLYTSVCSRTSAHTGAEKAVRRQSSSCGVRPSTPDTKTAGRRWEPRPQSWQYGLFRRRCPASGWCRSCRPPGSPWMRALRPPP